MNLSRNPLRPRVRTLPLPDSSRYVPSFKETLITFLIAAAGTVVFFLAVHSCR